MPPIIEANNLTVRYGQSEVLKELTFSINSGDFIGLAGPNGAGKTTLIKALLGLLPIFKGKVIFFGQSQKKFKDWQKIGYLPQKILNLNPLFPATVKEVITLGLLAPKKIPKIITKEDQAKTEIIMGELKITNLKDKLLTDLSGGQQQRVLLARCLVANPEILIFDEPSTALDPEARASFFNLIEKWNKEKGLTIILITHDTGYIGRYANKLMYLDRQLIYFGSFSDFCRSEKMNFYFGDYGHHLICHQHD